MPTHAHIPLTLNPDPFVVSLSNHAPAEGAGRALPAGEGCPAQPDGNPRRHIGQRPNPMARPCAPSGGMGAAGPQRKHPRAGGWAQPTSPNLARFSSTEGRLAAPAWRLFHTPLFRPIPLSGPCSAVVPSGVCLLSAADDSIPRLRNNLQAGPPLPRQSKRTIPTCAPSHRATTAIQPQSCFNPSPRAPRHGGAGKNARTQFNAMQSHSAALLVG